MPAGQLSQTGGQPVAGVLARLARDLQCAPDSENLLVRALKLLTLATEAQGAAISLFNDDFQSQCFRAIWFSNGDPQVRTSSEEMAVDKVFCETILRCNDFITVNSTAGSSRLFIEALDGIWPSAVATMLVVPVRLKNTLIGLLWVINKNGGLFNEDDQALGTSIAGFLAHPVENERLQTALASSLDCVTTLNRIKDRVVHHFSHALKTPLAVLLASFELMRKTAGKPTDQQKVLFERIQRNLDRLLALEYEIEDILQGKQNAVAADIADHGENGTNASLAPKNSPSSSEQGFFRQVNTEFLVHELKDPLSVIETNVSMLMQREVSAKATADSRLTGLKRVLRAARKTRDMLYTVLEVGRAESDVFSRSLFSPVQRLRQTLLDVLESVDPQLFEAVQDLAAPQVQFNQLAAEGGIRIEVQPAAEPVKMNSDDVKYSQIVANLLRNGLSYRRRRMMVLISLQREELCVAVRDDGPGIAPGHHEAIFERYKQVQPDPGVARGGHGLGLGVSRILARAMGGDITIESQLGQGALFRLTLPLVLGRQS